MLVLDRGEYLAGNSRRWSKTVDMNTVFNRMLAAGHNDKLAIRWHFTIDPKLDVRKAGIRFALERESESVYELNGHPITLDFLPDEYYIDRSIGIVKLPAGALKHGVNELVRRTGFHQREEIFAALERAKFFEGEGNKLYYDSEVEAVYLLGKFGVSSSGGIDNEEFGCRVLRGTPVIVPQAASVASGELVRGGCPFFSGEFKLTREFKLTAEEAGRFSLLRFAPFKANSVTAILNGVELGTVAMAPYELPLGDALRKGRNQLELRITTSCRNTLGPLHTVPVEPSGIGPLHFLEEPDVMNRPIHSYAPEYGVLEYGPEKISLV